MKYFKGVKSFNDLKDQFKKLAKVNHPDAGGKVEVMQEVNAEYDQLFPVWKTRFNNSVTADERSTETASGTRSEFYTQNGWKGKNYNSSLYSTDIAKILRTYVKEIYPTYKFSVTVHSYSGGSSINVSLMEAPHEVFTDKASEDVLKRNYAQIYRVREADESITELTKAVLKDVYNTLQSYNRNDSDAQIDYFDVNFYSSLNIGKWDKPFKVVEKTARIKTETKTDIVKSKKENTSQQEVKATTPEARTDATNNEYTITEDADTRDNSKIYIVKCVNKLSREEYLQTAKYMQSLGGYYSRFKHGFLFKENPTDLLNIDVQIVNDNQHVTDDVKEPTKPQQQQAKVKEPEPIKVDINFNTSKKTIELSIENLTEDVIQAIKKIGFREFKGVGLWIAQETPERKNFINEYFKEHFKESA